MADRYGIPLRHRDSFFQDPYFSDCWDWDPMDRLPLELRSRTFFTDHDDLDNFGFRTRIGLNRKVFDPDVSEPAQTEKEYELKSSEVKTSTANSNLSENLQVKNDTGNFKVLLDVQQFKPEELSVNVKKDLLVIEGKHEEQADSHGSVSRRFTRSYNLPKDVQVEELQCNLSSDGVLQVMAPRNIPRGNEKQTSSSNESNLQAADTKLTTDADKITNKSSRLGQIRNDSDMDSFFESHFTGFPGFGMVPFWKRRSLSRGQSEVTLDEKQKQVQGESTRKTVDVLSDLDNFKIQLDVQQFSPHELSIKTVGTFIMVEGKHDEKKDSFGSTTRHFTRKFEIPGDVRPEDVKCLFSKSGFLILSAPRQKPQLYDTGSCKETLVSIKVNQGQASEKQTSADMTTAGGNITGSGKEHVIHICLEKAKEDSSTNENIGHMNTNTNANEHKNGCAEMFVDQETDVGGRKRPVTKPAQFDSHLVDMLETFAEDLKAIDPKVAAETAVAGTKATKETEEAETTKKDSNLQDMLEDFSDKLKSLSKPGLGCATSKPLTKN